MKEIFLIRHGETNLNASGAYFGRTNVPLNETGIAQAKSLSQRLAGAKFDAVYTSPAIRCRQTAAYICPDGVAIVQDDLIEMDFGDWEGKSAALLQDNEPDAFSQWANGGPHAKAPGGESLIMLSQRVTACFDSILDAHTDAKLLLISHGGPIRCIAAHVFGFPAERGWHFAVNPGSLSCLHILEDRYPVLYTWNT